MCAYRECARWHLLSLEVAPDIKSCDQLFKGKQPPTTVLSRCCSPLSLVTSASADVLTCRFAGDDISDSKACIWEVCADTTKSLLRHQLVGHTRAVDAARFSRFDGSQAITAGKDNTIRMWDVPLCYACAGGESDDRPDDGGGGAARAGNGDDGDNGGGGDRASSVVTCTRIFGDVAGTGAKIYPREPFAIWSMAVVDLPVPSARGSTTTMVAVAGDTTTPVLWDLATGTICCEFPGHFKLVQGIAASRCASFLVTGSYDQTIRVFDLQVRLCACACACVRGFGLCGCARAHVHGLVVYVRARAHLRVCSSAVSPR